MDALYNLIYCKPEMIMILGGACSEVTKTLGEIVPYWNLILFSYASISPALSKREVYKTFVSLAPADSSYNVARMLFIKHFKWDTVATIYEDTEMYSLIRCKMEDCSFKRASNSDCHKSMYSRKKFITEFTKLKPEEQEILLWRSGLRNHVAEVTTICNHHMQQFGPVFERNQDKCCDVFNAHKKKVKGVSMLSLESAKQLASKGFNVIPGWKFCCNCKTKFSNTICESIDEDENMEDDFQINETGEHMLKDQLNASLDSLGESPVKLHGLASHRRVPIAKRKLEKTVEKLEESVSSVYGVDVCKLKKSEPSEPSIVRTKAADLDRLTSLMKEKIRTSSFNEIVQILTLTPESWSREYAAKYFEVSEHLIRKACRLKREKGILAMPSKKMGKKLSSEVIALVEAFYEDDEYSRQMPGKKDYVSVGLGEKGHVHKQKRLLLCNLKELYVEFKRINLDVNIGFSKFCSLRPKWCVTAGSTGTHSVCVCIHHQNAILLINAISWDVTYKNLMEKIVCDTSSNECMVHRCSNCPGTHQLRAFLDEELKDVDEDQEFHFNQWKSTDRSQLITQTVTVDEYKELAIECIDALTSHSYISKCQAKYLKDLKENLPENECIVLGDFAENYQYIVQDEIQGYHWSKDGCTLHPVVLYYQKRDNDVLTMQHKSFCFMSDDKNHDTCFVYEVQKNLTSYIKTNLPVITKIHYFSDGCGGQYKNYKNFYNLCLHFKDFGLKAEWVFFATSHGKSPCDGIGGTVKRTTVKASLQRTITDQILTVESMFQFCSTKMTDIFFVLIDAEQMAALRPVLNKRFTNACTVPGTRSFHHYIPVSETSIAFKRTSEDIELQSFNLLSGSSQLVVKQTLIEDLKQADFVACRYDKFWWVGMIDEVDHNNKDLRIKFMHPHGPSERFTWPSRDDLCWVPMDNIISNISIPTTRSGRIYDISEQDYETIIANA